MKQINIKIDKKQHSKLSEIAKKEFRSLKGQVQIIILNYLNDYKKVVKNNSNDNKDITKFIDLEEGLEVEN